MRALSLDLRERIVAAYEAGEGSQEAIGKRFGVAGRTVGKLVQQKRELGTLEPQVHRRGRKPAVQGEKLEELKAHLREFPDATVLERLKDLELTCAEKTLWQTLRKLGWRYKKNHRGLRSKSVMMS